jgi:GNAT superfamily N-acetyltransferase
LDALFVEPHLWKHGIGRRLVEHVAEVARLRAAPFLHVIGNPHAEGFYVACGFRVIGMVETRFGVGLDMRRPLQAAAATRGRVHKGHEETPLHTARGPDTCVTLRR